MESYAILNDDSLVVEYEVVLLKSKIEQLQQVAKANAVSEKDREEIESKYYQAISRHIGQPVDKNTLNNIPQDIRVKCLDEVFSSPDALIKPSHQFKKYSLIHKRPELQEYIPTQRPHSPLALLNDKSTSRALEIVREYNSTNTQMAQSGDLIYWHAWLSAVGFSFNEEITEKEVLSFIVQHAEGLDSSIDKKLVEQAYKSKLGPHKLSTIKRRIASLSVFLELAKWPNPCHAKEIKIVLQKLTKKYGGTKPAGKAITKDILDDMLDTCKDKLLDIRDKALLLFAWASGGRRRSEVTAADMKDMSTTPDGNFIYNIPKSKTDQEQKGHPVPVKGKAAQALQDWLNASQITVGAIFRSIGKSGDIRKNLSPNDVHRIVRKRLKKAGYDESFFGAHGLRSGFVTEAGRRSKPLGDVMAMTTHRNVGTVMKYYQAGAVTNNSASNLAD